MIKKVLVAALITSGLSMRFSNPGEESFAENRRTIIENYDRLVELKSLHGDDRKTVKESNYMYPEDFDIFNRCSFFPEFNTVDFDEKTNEVILYDITDDLYIYAKKLDEDEVFLKIDDNEFLVQSTLEDMVFISKSGNRLVVFETLYNEGTPTRLDMINNLTGNTKGSWILTGSHLKKTNTLLLEAISIMSGIASCIPLGTAFTVTLSIIGVFSAVGQRSYVTLYIDYDMYYRSDCTTYLREYDRYFQYSNYSGNAGASNYYYHTVRPDYAGQNCLAYQ